MAGYTKEFLVDAFMHRYRDCNPTYDLRDLVAKHYDEVGKDKFRVHASLDADAIKVYKATKTST